jgi:mediator of RNA polymerase II transcription subunit 31
LSPPLHLLLILLIVAKSLTPCPQFVQSLASPLYLNHLAAQKYLENPTFVAYLSYLQYWTQPPYLKYLTYPGPTLKHLELLQQERFRIDILNPEIVGRLMEEALKKGLEGPAGS